MNRELATIEDEAEVYNLVCELEDTTFDVSLFHFSWLKSLQDEQIQHFIYYDEHKAVGLCSLRILLHLHHCANVAQIEEFIVCKQMRRQGIGKQMFQDMVKVAQSNKCVMLELSSREHRLNAHKFYKKQGMQCHHHKFTMIF